MNRLKTIPIFFVVIQALLAANAFSLNTPYLTSATPTNGHSIALTWRNNDFDATQVLVLRKTAVTEWVLKDSVAGTVTAYTDSSLQPLTEYSFALLASAPGLLSDTSNVLTSTTLKESEIFAAPVIAVVWTEGQKCITVHFFDSNNTEKGFRLFRKTLTESWASIDSMVTQAPDTVGLKSFADSTIAENKWYSYKVQVYNDSQTVFSPETTVYNYVPPKKTKSYLITKKGSIPAIPISWVERIGDSLYFPEVASPGDTEISVVDVSNNSSPLFRGYVDPKNIPVGLKGSVVEARAVIPSNGNLFIHRNGYYIVSRESAIFQYDSASLSVHDSVTFFNGLNVYRLIGWLDDSCCLVFMMQNSDNGAWPVHFGSGGIDTFPRSIRWYNFSASGHYSYWSFWGCYKGVAVFSHYYYTLISITNTYIALDFSTGYTTPLSFSENVSDELFDNVLFGHIKSEVFDTSVVFVVFTSRNAISSIELYAFNIADAHSGPSASFLGKLADSSFQGSNVKEIIVDSKKKNLYVIGDSGIFIYSYSIGPAGVRHPIVSRNSPAKRLLISQNFHGVCFSIIGAKMQSLQVLNAKGQIVRSAVIPAGETFVWNRRDNTGTAVPVGFYIYKIGTLRDGTMTGSMVLVR